MKQEPVVQEIAFRRRPRGPWSSGRCGALRGSQELPPSRWGRLESGRGVAAGPGEPRKASGASAGPTGRSAAAPRAQSDRGGAALDTKGPIRPEPERPRIRRSRRRAPSRRAAHGRAARAAAARSRGGRESGAARRSRSGRRRRCASSPAVGAEQRIDLVDLADQLRPSRAGAGDPRRHGDPGDR